MNTGAFYVALIFCGSIAAAHAQRSERIERPSPPDAAMPKVLDCSKYPVWEGKFCAKAKSVPSPAIVETAAINDEVVDRSRSVRLFGGVAPKSVSVPFDGDFTHPKKEIPFEIVGELFRNLIEEALCQWQQTTVVSFHPATKNEENPVIKFLTGVNSCSVKVDFPSVMASVGTCNDKTKIANAGSGAFAHEIGHLLGLQHEQTRTDATNYFDIAWDKMSASRSSQFRFEYDFLEKKKLSQPKRGRNISQTYDFASIMHYSPRPVDFWWKFVKLPENVPGPLRLLPLTSGLLDEQRINIDEVGKLTCISLEDAATIDKLYGGKK